MADSQPPEGLQPKISDDEQSRHPQAFQVLYDAYRHMDCPTAVDPVDPDDCASVAEESVRVLMQAGLLLPSGGEVSTQLGCRTVDDLLGVMVEEATSRRDAELRVGYHNRVYATRNTYGGRAELVSREVHTGPWSPVLSDNTEGQPQ